MELTLRTIHGIAWRPGLSGGDNDRAALSRIKAYVSFSGSVPKMKVSSFTMCPESGSLVIDSNTPELTNVENKEIETKPEERQLLDITFTDPFQEERLNKKLSSNDSSSSENSSSSYRPHLQFLLRGSNGDDRDDVQAKSDDERPDSRRHKILKFHIVFRSLDHGAIAEGVANLRFPERNFESLPLILDLPIIQTSKKNLTINAKDDATKLPQIFFDESACIRVHLHDSTKDQDRFSSKSTAPNEFVLSDNVDEIQLGGMVKKIHEHEGMQKFHYDATKSNLFGSGNKNPGKRRLWAFGCSESMDIKHSIQSFFDGIRGFQTKFSDPEEREFFRNTTMTSTIVTRESLKI
jgi:hypothetical protein